MLELVYYGSIDPLLCEVGNDVLCSGTCLYIMTAELRKRKNEKERKGREGALKAIMKIMPFGTGHKSCWQKRKEIIGCLGRLCM